MINKIDNNYPLDITPIKNFPESIRDMYRIYISFGTSIDLFPE